MKKVDLNEAMSAANTVLDAIVDTLHGKSGTLGAQVRQRCGQLSTNGASQLSAGGNTFWQNLVACFEAAQQAGASYDAMDKVRSIAEALVVTSPAAIAVKNFSVRIALSELARILAATEFKSRADVDEIFDRIDAAFETAEIVAADRLDNVSYKALIAIHAAVSNDLANRARPLPRMISYTFASGMPALALAQRIYQDPSRADDLIAENKPIHPLFMPNTGKALSS